MECLTRVQVKARMVKPSFQRNPINAIMLWIVDHRNRRYTVLVMIA